MEPYRFLPSERIAVTIEEFLEGCRAEPMLAADHLHRGYFEAWLRDAGRAGLAEAVVQVRQADIAPGLALQRFLQAARPSRRRMRGLGVRLSMVVPHPLMRRRRTGRRIAHR